ncbi:CesT family type III secretion system chaperone [Sorangium cellulosum]|uniref:CesT family type III secretion system chaperone n=1 Tax=Sorangium cellulosum TaxID=56 RepID=UPI001010FD32|nr:YbjN domain-containing protein [Sorangium cellulosum]
MIDVTTLQRWTEEIGYSAELEQPSTLRIRPREEGIVELPPFYVQCTENWVVLSMFGVLDQLDPQGRSDGDEGPDPLVEDAGQRIGLHRYLLEANRDMRVAKFALDHRDEILLCAEMPTESLDQSEFADALERIIEYATAYRHALLGDGG